MAIIINIISGGHQSKSLDKSCPRCVGALMSLSNPATHNSDEYFKTNGRITLNCPVKCGWQNLTDRASSSRAFYCLFRFCTEELFNDQNDM